jgi:hypothetical protein
MSVTQVTQYSLSSHTHELSVVNTAREFELGADCENLMAAMRRLQRERNSVRDFF